MLCCCFFIFNAQTSSLYKTSARYRHFIRRKNRLCTTHLSFCKSFTFRTHLSVFPHYSKVWQSCSVRSAYLEISTASCICLTPCFCTLSHTTNRTCLPEKSSSFHQKYSVCNSKTHPFNVRGQSGQN